MASESLADRWPARTVSMEAARRAESSTGARRSRPSAHDGCSRPSTTRSVAAWNGLAITGLATAGRAFDERDAARRGGPRAQTFVWERMRVDGRLQRAWRDGRPSGPGFLDDHALLGLGMLALFETTGDIQWFERAGELSDAIVACF